MKLSSVVKALWSLCLLLAEGFPVSKDGSPHIIGADQVKIQARPGEPLVLHCEAFSNSEGCVTLSYWLVDGSFPEETPSRGRMVESDESTLEEGTILQKSLLLKNVTSEDFKSTFTCVMTSAGGMAQKHIKLTAASCGCKSRKKRKQH